MGTRVAVFASGGGSNFQSILEACARGELNAEVCLLVVDREGCGAIDKARASDVPVATIRPSTFNSFDEFDSAIAKELLEHRIEFVALAGYLKKIGPAMLACVQNQVVNTHPSLLPKYGGPGMYGMNVHRAVVNARERCSGITVHWVNEQYDDGAIIAQKKVQIEDGDTAEMLAERIKSVENSFYVSVLKSVIL